MWISAFPESRKQWEAEKQDGQMGSDMTQWGLSSVQPAAHKTVGHRSQCAYSPARLKHTPMPCPPLGTSVALESPALQTGTSEL